MYLEIIDYPIDVFARVLCCSLFWYALLYVLSSFAIILTRKIELAALLSLSFESLVTVNVLWLFLTVPWVGLQFVIVVFPDRTYLLFDHRFNLVLPVIRLYLSFPLWCHGSGVVLDCIDS